MGKFILIIISLLGWVLGVHMELYQSLSLITIFLVLFIIEFNISKNKEILLVFSSLFLSMLLGIVFSKENVLSEVGDILVYVFTGIGG